MGLVSEAQHKLQQTKTLHAETLFAGATVTRSETKSTKTVSLDCFIIIFFKLKTGEKKITFQVKISLVRGDVL